VELRRRSLPSVEKTRAAPGDITGSFRRDVLTIVFFWAADRPRYHTTSNPVDRDAEAKAPPENKACSFQKRKNLETERTQSVSFFQKGKAWREKELVLFFI
jgi:hypothetical protein